MPVFFQAIAVQVLFQIIRLTVIETAHAQNLAVLNVDRCNVAANTKTIPIDVVVGGLVSSKTKFWHRNPSLSQSFPCWEDNTGRA